MLKRHLMIASLLAGAILAPRIAAAQLTGEELKRVELSEPMKPHWVWVNDVSFSRMIDGRAYLIDGDSGSFLGMVGGGYGHTMLQIAPAGDRFTVPATYYSRGSRGERTDVVTLYDVKTLSPAEDVIIPAKRFSGLPFIGSMPLSDDGRFSLIYNFTPEQSLSVIDLRAKKFVGEYPTPGCGLVYPTGDRRFFMQCGDGSLQAASLNETGAVTLGKVSPKLFEFTDPATEKAVRVSPTEWLFFTYKGEVNVIDHAGAVPERREKWPLQDARTAGWVIGGMQPAAYHAPSGSLFTLMHEGGPETHKDPGTEVWVYDAKRHHLLKRFKLDGTATSIAVSGDNHPLLYTVMAGVADLTIYDATSGSKLRTVAGLGETLTYLQPAPVRP